MTSHIDLRSAAAAAIAADKAEGEVARDQAKAKNLTGKELKVFLAARWVDRAMPVIRALADPTRMRMVTLLAVREPLEVGVIAKELNVRSSTISQHLALLREARVIVPEKQGVKTFCWLNRDFLSLRFRQIGEHLEIQ